MEPSFGQLHEATRDRLEHILANAHHFDLLWIKRGEKFWLQHVISLRHWVLQHQKETPETMDHFFIRILKVLTSKSFDKILEWVRSLNLILDSKWFLPDAQAFLNTRIQESVPQCTAAFISVFGFLPNISHEHTFILRSELSLSLQIVSAFFWMEFKPETSWVPPESWVHPVVYTDNFNSYLRAKWGTTLLHLLEVEVEEINWWSAPILPLTGHLAEELMLLFQTYSLPCVYQEPQTNDVSVCTMGILPPETNVDPSSFLKVSILESSTSEAAYLDFTYEDIEDSNQPTENRMMAHDFAPTHDYIMSQNYRDNSSQQQLSNSIYGNYICRKRTWSGLPVASIASNLNFKLELHVVLEKYLSLKSDKSDSYKFSGPCRKFFKGDDDNSDDDSQSKASTQNHEEIEFSINIEEESSWSTESERCDFIVKEDKDFNTTPIQEEEGDSLYEKYVDSDGNCESYLSEPEDYDDSITNQVTNAHHVSLVSYSDEESEFSVTSFLSPMKVEDETHLFLSTPPSSIELIEYLPLTPPSSNQHSEDEKENRFTSTPIVPGIKKPFSRQFHFESSDEETTTSPDSRLKLSALICQASSQQQAKQPKVETKLKKLGTRRARNECQAKRVYNTTPTLVTFSDASFFESITMSGQKNAINKQVARPSKRKYRDS